MNTRASTIPARDPRQPGGRYFSGYWRHEYTVDVMFCTVYPSRDDATGAFRWVPGVTWYGITWIPSELAMHPRASAQWRGEGHRSGRHCTMWDAHRDEVVSQPAQCSDRSEDRTPADPDAAWRTSYAVSDGI